MAFLFLMFLKEYLWQASHLLQITYQVLTSFTVYFMFNLPDFHLFFFGHKFLKDIFLFLTACSTMLIVFLNLFKGSEKQLLGDTHLFWVSPCWLQAFYSSDCSSYQAFHRHPNEHPASYLLYGRPILSISYLRTRHSVPPSYLLVF